MSQNERRPSVSASSPPTSIPIPPNTRSLPSNSNFQASSPPNFSTSPGQGFSSFSPNQLGTSPLANRMRQTSMARALHAFLPPTFPAGEAGEKHQQKGALRVLLLENISLEARDSLVAAGYEVDHFTKAFSESELIEKLPTYHAVGIRSKTKITAKVIEAAPQLLSIGCFCIGTNQVNLEAAAKAGIAVFNSPFSNSRSVAELVIGEIIGMSRQLFDRVSEMRAGIWNKVSKGCWEIRGKTLGIVGYGHIGSQLSVLAEAFGMQVIYYDIVPIMPLGSARQVETLEELVSVADFISLHVPELPETINLVNAELLSHVKRGAYIINDARGKVVDLNALCDALESGALAGACIDVFPSEPGSNGAGFNEDLGPFIQRLRNIKNVALTPHIGGSTEEAQRLIGVEVSSALTRYLNTGSTTGCVSLAEVDLRVISQADLHIRITYTHKNEPGALLEVNKILGKYNVEKQFSDTKGSTGYLMCDVSGVGEEDVKNLYYQISATRANILTRLLY